MENLNELLKDAIACNNINFLELNKHKYSINHRFSDEDNDTLLLYSISDYSSEVYHFFLENGADITCVNDMYENIIHSIVYSGRVDRLKLISHLYPMQIHSMLNGKSIDGTTPIMLSVLLNKVEIFNFLINSGANINIVDNDGNAPIHPACSLGYEGIIKKLVENGANLHLKTNKGNYPLALAINEDHDNIVRFLYEKIYR